MKKLLFKKGFTLVELIVSVALFVTVVVIGLGAVLSIFDANNKSQSIASVMNNLNYSLDSMTRGIRFSHSYHCGSLGDLSLPHSCSDGDTSFAVSSSSDIIVYSFNNTTKTIEKSVNGETAIPVIGDEVTINYAKFYVLHAEPPTDLSLDPADVNEPYVVLVIKGFAGKKLSTQSTFDLETTISQRQLDL